MKSVVAQALKGDKTPTKLVVNFLQKLPKYAFEEDEVVSVMTKRQLEELEKAFQEAAKTYAQLCEPNSNQEQGNGSSSSPGVPKSPEGSF